MSQRFVSWKPLNSGPVARSAAYSRASLKGTLASQGVVTGGRNAGSSFQTADQRLPGAASLHNREAVITTWIRRQRNLPPYFKPDPSAAPATAMIIPAHENGHASLSFGTAPNHPSFQTMGKKPPKSDKPVIHIPGLPTSITPSFNALERKRAEVRATWEKLRESYAEFEITGAGSVDERIRAASTVSALNQLEVALPRMMQAFRQKYRESQNTVRMHHHLLTILHEIKTIGFEEFVHAAEQALASFERMPSYRAKRNSYHGSLATLKQFVKDLWERDRQTQILVRKMNSFLGDPAAPDEIFVIADDFDKTKNLPGDQRFEERKRLTAAAESVYTAEKAAIRRAASLLRILEGLNARAAGSVSETELAGVKQLFQERRAREALPRLTEILARAREIRGLSDAYREAIESKRQDLRSLCAPYPELADTLLQAESLSSSQSTLPDILNGLLSFEETLHGRIGAMRTDAPASGPAQDPTPLISAFVWHARETPDELQPEFFEWGTIRIESSRFKSVAKFYAEIQPAHQSAFWRRLNELDQSEGMPAGSANWETLSGHPNLLSAEVTNGIRLIIRKKGADFLIEDLGPHDAVYARLPKPKK